MKLGTWARLNEVEENLHEAKAILDVVSDGLCNEIVAVNNGAYATTIGLAYEKIEKALGANQQLFAIYRGDSDEDKLDIWKEWEGEAPIRADDGEVESSFQDGEGESRGSQMDEDSAYEYKGLSPRFNVKLKQEHEDGGATFIVEGEKEDIQKLFEVFFSNALISGIDYAEEKIGKASARHKVVESAMELNNLLFVWENSEDMDYSPTISRVRKELDNNIRAMERCGKAS
jgi:hypothetical protein